MEKFIVYGGNSLKGSVKISGSKNAALPILISSLLANGESIFFNVPAKIDDVKNIFSVLSSLGVFVDVNSSGFVKINTVNMNSYEPPYELVCKMRASILLLGPLIARFGRVKLFLPGGCSIGTRPVDLHLKAFKKLGVKIKLKNTYIEAFSNKLKGNYIFFDINTVTGTENLIMGSVLASGITILDNAACEPEIISLSHVLIKMGAKIVGAGTSRIIINGVKRLNPVSYSIIPDRIEAGTFMVAAALTGGDVKLINCMPNNLILIINKLRDAGALIDIEGSNIHVKGMSKINCINLKTLPYPGFPTDMQAIFMVLMCVSDGISVIFENIFENRFVHVKELNKMGANITINNRYAVIRGVKSLYGTKVYGNDLRASASLVLAGLVAIGKTEVFGINHLDRGYEFFEKKILSIGGKIRREK